jgi:tetratricopeptide (TPR) repeat protein
VLVALAGELHHSSDPRRHEFARAAVEVARRTGDLACLAQVLGHACFALWQPGNLPERVEIATELSELAEALGDPVLEIEAGVALYYATAMYGHMYRARAALAMAGNAAEDLGQPAPRLRVLLAQQSCALLDGRFADFKRYAAEALYVGEALRNPDAGWLHRSDSGTMHYLRGEIGEALEGFLIGVELIPHPCMKAAVALAYAETGAHLEAVGILAGLGGASLAGIPRDYMWMLSLAFTAAACGVLRDVELAARLFQELLPYRAQMVSAQVGALGPVAHYVGLLAGVLERYDEAEEHFAYACDLAERTGARGLLVRTRLEWARLVAGRDGPGDRERARHLAASARDLAHELDAPVLAEQACALLVVTAFPSRGHGRELSG